MIGEPPRQSSGLGMFAICDLAIAELPDQSLISLPKLSTPIIQILLPEKWHLRYRVGTLPRRELEVQSEVFQ